tara:strand:- start:583 stop:1035 length:453 start_codon:yes stop_codon:yes gene_type:complete
MASKKKKSVKKYAVGGDLRQNPNPLGGGGAFDPSAGAMALPNPGDSSNARQWDPDGTIYGGNDDTASGQVKQISDSARMAAQKLRGAGQAQQQAGSMLGNEAFSGPGVFYKKGGKVKKSAKKSAKTSVKVRGAGMARGGRPCKMVKMKGS